jgi:2-isopropylmalate synthase
LQRDCGIALTFLDYSEHAVGGGEDARAAAYVKIRSDGDDTLYGVGIDANIVTASLRAVASAATRVRKAAIGK